MTSSPLRGYRWVGETFHPPSRETPYIKGDAVQIQGRLRSSNWVDKRTGEKRYGMEIVADKVVHSPSSKKKPGRNGRGRNPRDSGADDRPRRIDDPVRMYLTQMGEISLLTREEEIRLAKKIETTRMIFRRRVLENDYAIGSAAEILELVEP